MGIHGFVCERTGLALMECMCAWFIVSPSNKITVKQFSASLQQEVAMSACDI